uniref:Transmembrane 4 L six family member 19 n=1 Tax=Ornithorhynchus anatinus TaxID=9258 RepID=A0A6I8NZD2_ORNAN
MCPRSHGGPVVKGFGQKGNAVVRERSGADLPAAPTGEGPWGVSLGPAPEEAEASAPPRPVRLSSLQGPGPGLPPAMTCPASCSRLLGFSLAVLALLAAAVNVALLFPTWEGTYLSDGHIGKHALLGPGLWGGGLLVLCAAVPIAASGWRCGCFRNSGPCQNMLLCLLTAGLAFFGAAVCFVVSGVALKTGPLCLFDVAAPNRTRTQKWGYPFLHLHRRLLPSQSLTPGRERHYLHDRSLWDSVCIEPPEAVTWHVSFFSTLLAISLLQLLLVVTHVVSGFCGLLCGFCGKS